MVVVEKSSNFTIQKLPDTPGFFRVVKATVWKDLLMKKRYKADLIGDIIRSLMFIAVFALFSTAFQFQGLELSVNQTLLFFLSGFLLIVFDGVALWTPLNSVNRDLYNGTLEYLYSSPQSRLGYFLGNIIASAIFSSVILVPILVFFQLMYKFDAYMVGMMLLTLTGTVLVLIGFGVMFALLGILFKKVSALAGVLSMLFQFLGGFLFPITSLPAAVKFISYLLPYTWGIDIIRYYIMPGWVPLLPVGLMWGILAAQGLVLWLIAIQLIKKVEVHAKKNGLHLI